VSYIATVSFVYSIQTLSDDLEDDAVTIPLCNIMVMHVMCMIIRGPTRTINGYLYWWNTGWMSWNEINALNVKRKLDDAGILHFAMIQSPGRRMETEDIEM
jgi:hypothetical protein